MTFSPGPASFIRGRKSASPSSTRGGSRVPEWGPLGSVRGALSNERPYRDLGNVVANYPFESLRGFPRSEPNSGHADHSRLSCSTGDTQLGLGSAGIFQQAGGTTSGPGAARLGDLDHSIAATAAPDRGTNIHRHKPEGENSAGSNQGRDFGGHKAAAKRTES